MTGARRFDSSHPPLIRAERTCATGVSSLADLEQRFDISRSVDDSSHLDAVTERIVEDDVSSGEETALRACATGCGGDRASHSRGAASQRATQVRRRVRRPQFVPGPSAILRLSAKRDSHRGGRPDGSHQPADSDASVDRSSSNKSFSALEPLDLFRASDFEIRISGAPRSRHARDSYLIPGAPGLA